MIVLVNSVEIKKRQVNMVLLGPKIIKMIWRNQSTLKKFLRWVKIAVFLFSPKENVLMKTHKKK
jgi:hypothetical protein